jgi:hypothetical protein
VGTLHPKDLTEGELLQPQPEAKTSHVGENKLPEEKSGRSDTEVVPTTAAHHTEVETMIRVGTQEVREEDPRDTQATMTQTTTTRLMKRKESRKSVVNDTTEKKRPHRSGRRIPTTTK